ncbi:hypothetical protein [Nocardia sp. NPDC005825]|uniref:hypothetical protein n=1 Tax=Nocardia sp. NPDC005825 TaxID=3155452 RepID=UPI0033E18BCA
MAQWCASGAQITYARDQLGEHVSLAVRRVLPFGVGSATVWRGRPRQTVARCTRWRPCRSAVREMRSS